MSENDPANILARTIWAEARNQGTQGMKAVACVIQNRVKNPGWWGNSIQSVCLAAQQFSCWNPSDPQHDLIRSVTDSDALFRTAKAIAETFVHACVQDFTHGADHYCTQAVAARTRWTHGRTPVYRYGTHLFYRIGLSG